MRYTLPSQVAETIFRNISRIPLSIRERLLLTPIRTATSSPRFTHTRKSNSDSDNLERQN